MDIGTRRVIINHPPYTVFGHNDQPATFVTVEVMEERDSKCLYTGTTGTGYLAKGSDGYWYGYNYPEPNIGFSNTPWVRWMDDADFLSLSKADQEALVEDYSWSDLVDWQCPAEANAVRSLDFVAYCPTHQRHYYGSECRRCKADLKTPDVVMSLEEHAWAGWY